MEGALENTREMESVVRRFLELLGEDPNREGLLKTPQRVAQAWEYLTRGYRTKVEDIVNGAIFAEEYGDMVLVKDIAFYSMCEHHLLPFFGKAHVAYIPDGKIIGISKIPRIVEMYARRLQVQERLTDQIASTLRDAVKPKGVAVAVQARHLCMIMRGVEKQDSLITTRAFLGVFETDEALRREFMEQLRLAAP